MEGARSRLPQSAERLLASRGRCRGKFCLEGIAVVLGSQMFLR